MKLPRAMLILFIALALALCGCAQQPAEGQPAPAPTPAPANPLVAASAASLVNMGLPLAAPEGAENVVRYIIDETVAELFFDYEGRTYSYRAASAATDFFELSGMASGTEADSALTVWMDSETFSGKASVYLPDSGGALGVWQIDDARFTLFTLYDVSAEYMGELCLELMDGFLSAQFSARQSAISMQDFAEDLSIYIDAPAGAVAVRRSIYEGSIAQVSFTYEEHSFVYSAQAYPGVPSAGEFDHTEILQVQSGWGLTTMQLNYNDHADAAVCWSHGGINYSLYCTTGAEMPALPALALQLAAAANARTPSEGTTPAQTPPQAGAGAAIEPPLATETDVD